MIRIPKSFYTPSAQSEKWLRFCRVSLIAVIAALTSCNSKLQAWLCVGIQPAVRGTVCWVLNPGRFLQFFALNSKDPGSIHTWQSFQRGQSGSSLSMYGTDLLQHLKETYWQSNLDSLWFPLVIPSLLSQIEKAWLAMILLDQCSLFPEKATQSVGNPAIERVTLLWIEGM